MSDESPTESSPRCVLVLEDDDQLAELWQLWTEAYYEGNVDVHAARTVADAESILESVGSLDLALLDRQLPDGDGADLLEPIATSFDALAVMMTAVPPDSEIIRLPMDDYVVKPVEESEFVKRLSLLEKLDAADALGPYTDARKASLLEYHLDDPEDDPLFRRFASRWSYDRLEVARVDSAAVVYELYAGEDGDIRVRIAGLLAEDLEALLEEGALTPVGELVPSGEDYAWIETDDDGPIDPDPDVIAIYRFDSDAPEQYVAEASDPGAMSEVALSEILEAGFN